MAAFSTFLFLFFYVPAFLLTLSSTQEDPLDYVCSYDRGNFTNNSTYQGNINHLLSSFNSANIENDYGFYNLSVGQHPDRVNAIALCRGDVKPDACLSCLNNSATQLRSLCPNQREATVWYGNCMLRYSNRSIFGVMESEYTRTMWNLNNVMDVDGFSQALSNLLDSLRNRAASGDSRMKFASGEAQVSAFQRIYGLVQCTPDLSQKECISCLGTAFGRIPSYCNGREGGRILQYSCNVGYDVTPFYELAADAPQPASPLSLPPSPNDNRRRRRRGKTS